LTIDFINMNIYLKQKIYNYWIERGKQPST